MKTNHFDIRLMFNLSCYAVVKRDGRWHDIRHPGWRGYKAREFLDTLRSRPFMFTRYWREKRRWRSESLLKINRMPGG